MGFKELGSLTSAYVNVTGPVELLGVPELSWAIAAPMKLVVTTTIAAIIASPAPLSRPAAFAPIM